MSLFKRERLATLQQQSAAAADRRHSVLIVDDEDGNLRVLRSMLGDRYRVHEARDGQQALQLLQSLAPGDRPSVVLSDQRMPRMTGVELFEQLCTTLPNAIRIIITGFVDIGAIVDAINRASIYKFVVKPFDHHELRLTIERAIETYDMRLQIERHVAELEDKVRLRTAELEASNVALRGAYAEIERVSLTDPLTGLHNRRYLSAALDGPARQGNQDAAADFEPGAFLLIDIDHFKSVNDLHGHAAGDTVLRGLGQLLRGQLGANDVAVRWGGEEFLLHVRVADEQGALELGNRIRATIEQESFDLGDGRQLQRTCSVGIACWPFSHNALSWEQVLSLADTALYMAKRNGRNQAICLAAAGPLPAGFELTLAENPQSLVDAGLLRVMRSSS